jgi:hypothetical protein
MQNFNNTVKWLENSTDIYIDSSFTSSSQISMSLWLLDHFFKISLQPNGLKTKTPPQTS